LNSNNETINLEERLKKLENLMKISEKSHKPQHNEIEYEKNKNKSQFLNYAYPSFISPVREQ
jgi:hypothetical protein